VVGFLDASSEICSRLTNRYRDILNSRNIKNGSPTRAAILTGRNHHSAATGVITEFGTGYPGYSGQIPDRCAMVSEVLRQNGYSTAFFGKNHNIANWETSVSGPYDRWPGRQGFDHFYGFIGGEANQ
jgi:arylsulfatase